MVNQHYKKTLDWIERNRFLLLLLSTILTMVLPAFSGNGMLYEIIFVITMSFLFIQSMIVARVKESHKRLLRIIVISMIFLIWLKPAGIDSIYIDLVKLGFIVFFFIFVMTFLVKFISKSAAVNVNVQIGRAHV